MRNGSLATVVFTWVLGETECKSVTESRKDVGGSLEKKVKKLHEISEVEVYQRSKRGVNMKRDHDKSSSEEARPYSIALHVTRTELSESRVQPVPVAAWDVGVGVFASSVVIEGSTFVYCTALVTIAQPLRGNGQVGRRVTTDVLTDDARCLKRNPCDFLKDCGRRWQMHVQAVRAFIPIYSSVSTDSVVRHGSAARGGCELGKKIYAARGCRLPPSFLPSHPSVARLPYDQRALRVWEVGMSSWGSIPLRRLLPCGNGWLVVRVKRRLPARTVGSQFESRTLKKAYSDTRGWNITGLCWTTCRFPELQGPRSGLRTGSAISALRHLLSLVRFADLHFTDLDGDLRRFTLYSHDDVPVPAPVEHVGR
ncbi:hypothetical protein EDB89DRAFT_2243285 [Lactarius sanguifluus]|nr:hypothetical protein EDB89DRAFT_2243285 [Lactarius sanguifluus]